MLLSQLIYSFKNNAWYNLSQASFSVPVNSVGIQKLKRSKWPRSLGFNAGLSFLSFKKLSAKYSGWVPLAGHFFTQIPLFKTSLGDFPIIDGQ